MVHITITSFQYKKIYANKSYLTDVNPSPRDSIDTSKFKILENGLHGLQLYFFNRFLFAFATDMIRTLQHETFLKAIVTSCESL